MSIGICAQPNLAFSPTRVNLIKGGDFPFGMKGEDLDLFSLSSPLSLRLTHSHLGEIY
jgi:hypothetical protein